MNYCLTVGLRWPKTIVYGQDQGMSSNACKTGLGEGEIR